MFKVGTAYEVFAYDDQGRATVITEQDKSQRLPVDGCTFVPYNRK
jgi:ferredoxin